MKARLLNIVLEFMLAGIVLAILLRRWQEEQETAADAAFDQRAGDLYRQTQNEDDPLAGAVSLADIRRRRQERQS